MIIPIINCLCCVAHDNVNRPISMSIQINQLIGSHLNIHKNVMYTKEWGNMLHYWATGVSDRPTFSYLCPSQFTTKVGSTTTRLVPWLYPINDRDRLLAYEISWSEWLLKGLFHWIRCAEDLTSRFEARGLATIWRHEPQSVTSDLQATPQPTRTSCAQHPTKIPVKRPPIRANAINRYHANMISKIMKDY